MDASTARHPTLIELDKKARLPVSEMYPAPDAGWQMGPIRMTEEGIEADLVRKDVPDTSSSREVLRTADDIIHGERAASYGPAEESFARIGEFWTTHLSNKLAPGESVDAYDVAILMTLMKCARAQTDVKLDTFVDIAGYAALAPRCAAKAGK